MKELDFSTLFSVFQEMLGVWLWVVLAIAALVTAGFLYVLVRDRGFSSRRLVRAEMLAPFGGLAALVIMKQITESGWTDIGGPVDLMLVVTIFIGGAVGATMLAYLFQSLSRAP